MTSHNEFSKNVAMELQRKLVSTHYITSVVLLSTFFTFNLFLKGVSVSLSINQHISNR
jgi:hypothetical protein